MWKLIVIAVIAVAPSARTETSTSYTTEGTTGGATESSTGDDSTAVAVDTTQDPSTIGSAQEFSDRLRERIELLNAQLLGRWERLSTEEKTAISQRAEDISKRGTMRISTAGDNIAEVNARVNIDKDLVDGDMVITAEDLDTLLPYDPKAENDATRRKRQAYKTFFYPTNIWLNAMPIPYSFDSSLSTTETNRLRFVKGAGCWSFVGKRAFQQHISIGEGCETVGIAAHEIAHALGFIHSQNRIDRDDYLNINLGNVQPSQQYNFNKEVAANNDNYGMTYDLGSVMQYGTYAFAMNSSIPTMIAKETGYQNTMGQRLPTFYDVYMMNTHYQCFSQCPSPPTCLNNGVVDVNNCSKCVCPQGYGGNYCEARASGCGGNVLVGAILRNLTLPRIGSAQLSEDFDNCNYMLIGVGGRNISIIIRVLDASACSTGCTFSAIEFYLKADKRNSGYRYCCPEDVGQTIVSETSTMAVHLFSRYYFISAVIEYVTV